MLEVMKKCNNFFYYSIEGGKHIIANGRLKVRGKYLVGQYILIENSILNDGLYLIKSISEEGLEIEGVVDEEFEGVIWGLKVPRDFVELCKKITEYDISNNGKEYVSESFEGYSYTRATVNGRLMTGIQFYSNLLNNYRKCFDGKKRVRVRY